ncbi:hypothetical protein [Metabacillus bambusae]|uniref:Uncharacterized protein n=1 Tax=Metabacillus bambusae TaxID=2795218 RepID=A0ABS3N2X5_9BACI|nr:hypothetical protein [Metabacillus bambusae]MBO1512632.1 hypothetical protein [Metabacillus bambusae]
MSKSYTDQRLYTIYEEELNELTYNPTGLFDKLLHHVLRKFTQTIDLKYTFTVPVSDFLRGELFCEDVSVVIGKPFTQTNLISILLDDFLYQAQHKWNLYDLYRDLHSGIQHPIEIFHYSGEREILHINHETQRNKEIDCTINRKKALRLEVILSDLANLEPEITFSVNDVLQFIYCHFIQKYKEGTLTNELKRIVKRLA